MGWERILPCLGRVVGADALALQGPALYIEVGSFEGVEMRALWVSVFLLVGCGEDPPCGVDDDGNDVPYCAVNVEGYEEPLNYCPLEHWGAPDGCNSCGCDETGAVVCTSRTCDTGI